MHLGNWFTFKVESKSDQVYILVRFLQTWLTSWVLLERGHLKPRVLCCSRLWWWWVLSGISPALPDTMTLHLSSAVWWLRGAKQHFPPLTACRVLRKHCSPVPPAGQQTLFSLVMLAWQRNVWGRGCDRVGSWSWLMLPKGECSIICWKKILHHGQSNSICLLQSTCSCCTVRPKYTMEPQKGRKLIAEGSAVNATPSTRRMLYLHGKYRAVLC